MNDSNFTLVTVFLRFSGGQLISENGTLVGRRMRRSGCEKFGEFFLPDLKVKMYCSVP